MTVELSVVMPTYRRVDQLPLVLAPLLADPAVDEVVVVVDGSADGSLELLRSMASTEPRLRPVWQENAGAGAARQHGVESARGAVVLLLDDDVLAAPGLAAGHRAEHARQPGQVVLGAMPTPPVERRRPQDVTTLRYATDYDHACRTYLSDPDTILEHFWSGNLSLPRELALQVGLGDPALADLFPSEDRELGLRLRAAGARAVFRPHLLATHLHTRTLPRFREDSRRQGAAMQVLHRRYADLVPAPTGPALAGRLPRPARWFVTGARRSPAAGRAAELVALGGVKLFGAARWWTGQDIALVVLQRTCQAVGARRWPAGA